MAFKNFQRNYVAIWLCMMMADWLQVDAVTTTHAESLLTETLLQGPYVYALYASYGFSKKEIGELFIMVS